MPSTPRFKFEGVQRLSQTVSRRAAEVRGAAKKSDVVGVTIGYTKEYAIYVHENLQAIHPNGMAKFLTRAINAKRKEGKELVADLLKRKFSIGQALMAYGNMIKFESQRNVPVKTGALKASAYVKLERRL